MKTDDMRALAKKIAKARRGVTAKGFLKWAGSERGKPRKKGEYIGECTYLGDTLICLSSTYEGSPKDCEWVETACNEAPQMAAALKMAARDMDAQASRIANLEAEVTRLKAFEPSPPRYTCGDTCPTCSKCMGCGYCKCPGMAPHADDKPAAYSLPSDALAAVPA